MSQKRQRLSTSRSRSQGTSSQDELPSPRSDQKDERPKPPFRDDEVVYVSSDSDDEFIESCTFKNAVKDGVTHALVLSEQKYPFKKSDLFQKCPLSGKKADAAFKKINAYLDQIYGLGMFSIGDHKYILSSTFDYRCPDTIRQPKRRADPMGVLKLILCALHIQGKKADEETICTFISGLKEKGVVTYTVELKALLNDFVRQAYLTKSVDDSLPDKNVIYAWGPRATLEFKSGEIERFLYKVHLLTRVPESPEKK